MIRRRRLLVLAAYVLVLTAAFLLKPWLARVTGLELLPENESQIHAMIMTALMVYVVASALPFVPGAEIGMGLLLMFGGKIAALVYTSMVVALTLAFFVGRLVPVRAIAAALVFLGFARAPEWIDRLTRLDIAQRLDLLTAQAPRRIVPILLRHRYLTLALLFNVPGNSAIGGGGGIAFVAGMSRLFSAPAFVVTVLVAVAPVPLLFLLVEAGR